MRSRLLIHRVTVARATSAGGVKRTFQSVTTNLPCLIQPLDAEATNAYGMAMGRAYRVFCFIDSNVKDGDRLTDQDGRTLNVRGIRRHNYGLNKHLELMVEEDAEGRV